MSFNSVEFFLFFPFVTAIYFLLIPQWRWLWLLLASCYFYICFIPVYLCILFLLIIIDYAIGIFIEKSENKRIRRFLLVLSISSTCGILFIFKYFGFFNTNISLLAHLIGWNYSLGTLSLILPLGLSFHTFQSLSYIIEVYRRNQRAERHFGYYALYVMFFPQLVAGPIERPQHLLHQLHDEYLFDYQRVTNGLKLMAWGFFKKIMIADHLAKVVNIVYSSPQKHTGVMLVIATVFFAYQIYCDFSGYTDIARGSARVLGIELMENFNCPYVARSIKEFWQRWHISLSTWFKDYVYFPLGGKRVNQWRWYYNIMVVFALSGIWHGANWTFLIWGLLHGVYYLGSEMVVLCKSRIALFKNCNFNSSLYTRLKVILTFFAVTIAWVFFRSNNLGDAVYIIKHMGDGWGRVFLHFKDIGLGKDIIGLRQVGIAKLEYLKSIILIVLLEFIQRRGSSDSIIAYVNKFAFYWRWLIYYALLLWLILGGEYSSSRFIYFQF